MTMYYPSHTWGLNGMRTDGFFLVIQASRTPQAPGFMLTSAHGPQPKKGLKFLKSIFEVCMGVLGPVPQPSGHGGGTRSCTYPVGLELVPQAVHTLLGWAWYKLYIPCWVGASTTSCRYPVGLDMVPQTAYTLLGWIWYHKL